RGRTGVAVPVERDQGQRVRPAHPDPPGLERVGRQRPQRRPLPLQELGLRRRLPPQAPRQVRPAPLLDHPVEPLPRVGRRDGDEEVAAGGPPPPPHPPPLLWPGGPAAPGVAEEREPPPARRAGGPPPAGAAQPGGGR